MKTCPTYIWKIRRQLLPPLNEAMYEEYEELLVMDNKYKKTAINNTSKSF